MLLPDSAKSFSIFYPFKQNGVNDELQFLHMSVKTSYSCSSAKKCFHNIHMFFYSTVYHIIYAP